VDEGRKGGDVWFAEEGWGGGAEEGRSQGGGRMLALRWRLRRRASQRGRAARCGGLRLGVGP
jgi:hypothetical protein